MSSQPRATHPCPGKSLPRGKALLCDPGVNKGTAFSQEERLALGLRGLLPPAVLDMEAQKTRVMGSLDQQADDLQRYVQLLALQTHNETLYYRLLIDEIEALMPLVYTPTVGTGCQRFGHIYQRPQGMFISLEHRGEIREVLENWPCKDVRMIVVTDGERILGLGDQGAHGMGISIGKLALYTACAGLAPWQCLPVTLDVGTENEAFLADPLYLGLKQHRLRDEPYDAFVEEFFQAATSVFPKAVVQFEDFANRNAFRLLAKYRDRFCTFNDDIQGTASVALAGLLAGPRITGVPFKDQTFLFLGAGEAGIGIGELLMSALVQAGLPKEEARRRCWYVDSRGLVVSQRTDLSAHKKTFAHDHAPVASLKEAVEILRPTTLIGVSGQPQAFTREIVELMGRINERPVIMALSNPTSKAECTAEQAYTWTQGKAVFASGSPFKPVEYEGKTYVPGQGNNAYIFPGVGLGAVAVEATRITDDMFLAAAQALADSVSEEDLAQGRLYPALNQIRKVSLKIAVQVAKMAEEKGLAAAPLEADHHQASIAKMMYDPGYKSLV